MTGEQFRFIRLSTHRQKKESVFLGKKQNDYGTGIPRHEIEALARCILPSIKAYYESEEGRKTFAEWKAKRDKEKNKQSG